MNYYIVFVMMNRDFYNLLSTYQNLTIYDYEIKAKIPKLIYRITNFNQPINILPTNITHLTFGHNFNYL